MEKKRVMCPYDGVPYYKIPKANLGGDECPYCGAKKQADGTWPHQPVERVVMSDDEAVSVLMKYAKKHYFRSYNAGSDIFNDAWDSQWWGTAYAKKKKSWMGDDLAAAFEWWLDANGWYGNERGGTKPKEWLAELEEKINEHVRKAQKKKFEQQYQAQLRRDKKKREQGEKIARTLIPGSIVMVEFKNCRYWPTRGLLVEEVEDHFVAGFYLDRATSEVRADAPEEEGYTYSKPNEYTKTKQKWDGKTFKKTRVYVSKETKFVKEKLENAVIKKPN